MVFNITKETVKTAAIVTTVVVAGGVTVYVVSKAIKKNKEKKALTTNKDDIVLPDNAVKIIDAANDGYNTEDISPEAYDEILRITEPKDLNRVTTKVLNSEKLSRYAFKYLTDATTSKAELSDAEMKFVNTIANYLTNNRYSIYENVSSDDISKYDISNMNNTTAKFMIATEMLDDMFNNTLYATLEQVCNERLANGTLFAKVEKTQEEILNNGKKEQQPAQQQSQNQQVNQQGFQQGFTQQPQMNPQMQQQPVNPAMNPAMMQPQMQQQPVNPAMMNPQMQQPHPQPQPNPVLQPGFSAATGEASSMPTAAKGTKEYITEVYNSLDKDVKTGRILYTLTELHGHSSLVTNHAGIMYYLSDDNYEWAYENDTHKLYFRNPLTKIFEDYAGQVQIPDVLNEYMAVLAITSAHQQNYYGAIQNPYYGAIPPQMFMGAVNPAYQPMGGPQPTIIRD
jgi:hypothetical protein